MALPPRLYGTIAPMVEQMVEVLRVAGSNPARTTKFYGVVSLMVRPSVVNGVYASSILVLHPKYLSLAWWPCKGRYNRRWQVTLG